MFLGEAFKKTVSLIEVMVETETRPLHVLSSLPSPLNLRQTVSGDAPISRLQ